MKNIYVDHAATTPVHPEVIEAMIPYMNEVYGNPSSIHTFGRKARRGLDEAREVLARALGCQYEEITFTSGGTEADNLAVIGYAMANRENGNHLITTQVEHHGVLHAFEFLEKNGFDVTYLPVNADGIVSVKDVENALTENTILVSIMYANNETGAVQPIQEIGAFLSEHQAVFHSDAVQAFGIERLDMNELNVDMLTVSSHKINGPKGVGVLAAKKELTIQPNLYGGEQERKRRAGTENIPGIIGLKKAVELMETTRNEKRALYKSLRETLLSRLQEADVNMLVNGSHEQVMPHILNVSFPGVNVESLLTNLDLDGVAASSGSACTAGSIEPSHVLAAMFEDSNRSQSALRFSFGYGNDLEQIEEVAKRTIKIVQRLQT
ncbi:IscS subfamily cysteine desulfurase [Texcoconibacillus texcoconensis]|uniref:cysteine desulfurase n=1 Tax=Texcoconibacillus texcoconensis TaxID=1095777 RepID=A0A840QP82_9BACI|nr:cysteine desulfurase [Texcoconibacillus texcoconensis]